MRATRVIIITCLFILTFCLNRSVGGTELFEPAPLSEQDIKTMKSKLESVEFPIDAKSLLEQISLDSSFLLGRLYTYEKDGLHWTTSGKIHNDWTIRYRRDSESREFLDFEILYFHTRSEEIKKRARNVGTRMLRLASEGEIHKIILSRDFEDIVVMPKTLTEELSLLGTKLLGGKITVAESIAKDDGPSHVLTISGAEKGISIPLVYDPAFDRFHIIPGFEIVDPKEETSNDHEPL